MRVHFLRAKKSYAVKINRANISYAKKKLRENFPIYGTNNDYSRHRNLAADYQLVQSVLKIGSALAGRVRG